MTIWLDVTSTLRWAKKPVGIIRTELELIKHALKTDVRFVRFDNAGGRPSEVPMTDMIKALVNLETFTGDMSSDSRFLKILRAKPVGDTKHKMRWRAFAFYLEIPKWAKELVSIAYRMASKPQDLTPVEADLHHKCERSCAWLLFQGGDTVLSAGFNWEYLNLVELKQIKKTHGFKLATFAYDTIPAKFPQFVPAGFSEKFTQYFRGIVSVSEAIFAISEVTKMDVTEFCDQHQISNIPQMRVVKLGCDLASMDASPSLPEGIEPHEYVLLISTIECRKNHSTVYKAYARIAQENPGKKLPTMLFVGTMGWHVDDLVRDLRADPWVNGKKSNSQIKLLQGISDSELERLYKSALVSTFPSFYEGWGLPIAESQAFGTPAIVSSAGAAPEASAGLATVIDPLDTLAWKEELERFFFDEGYREQKSKILTGYKAPIWSDFCLDVFAQIESM